MDEQKPSLNLINSQDVDAYLKKFANGNEYLEKLLIAALSNIIKKSPDYMQTLSAPPEDAADWLTKKWDTKPEWHKFDPRKSMKLTGRVNIIALWLEEVIAHDEAWLKNTDDQGRPKKLLKFSTMAQLIKLQNEDEAQRKARLKESKREELQEETVDVDVCLAAEFDGGYKIVRLLTERALDRESAFLEHCIGDGAYDPYLGDERYLYYSLRDENNIPKATFGIDKTRRHLISCGGRRNALPETRHIQYIGTFCYKNYIDMATSIKFDEGYTVHDVWGSEGYVPDIEGPETPPSLHFGKEDDIALEDGTVASYLYIADIGKLKTFPKNVSVDGEVHFKGTGFPEARPEGWTVTGPVKTFLNHYNSWQDFLDKYYPAE